MIIDKEIRQLVNKIESENQIKPYLNLLLHKLKDNCIKSYTSSDLPVLHSNYPLDLQGYAKSFDPLYDENAIRDYWDQYGFVVGKNVCSIKQCEEMINTIHGLLKNLSMDLNSEKSYQVDSMGTPILSRGFFELYHDNALAQIRQNIRLYLYHVILWKTPFLWTTFDRLGLKTPEGESANGLPLHVDQNPLIHPEFTTMQGVLALDNCPIERGTFVAVPGSKSYFKEYQNFIKPDYKGEFIELPQESNLFRILNPTKQNIPLRKGNIVSWDSRTTHANSSNHSKENRYVAYISTGIAKSNNKDLCKIRKQYFDTGLGYNVRDAYLHASKKPRFTNKELMQSLRSEEILSDLGLCLYGLREYEDYL